MTPNPVYKYFKPEEVVGLDQEFCSKLDLATAQTAGIDPDGRRFPFTITSGLRSVSENQSTPGAVCDSAHLKGMAVDLRVSNGHEAFLVTAAAISVGITRYGYYTDTDNQITHVHLDVDVDDRHPAQVMWFRKEGAPYNTAPATA